MNGTVNKVILIGHLGDDVKIHYFNADSCIGRFSIATNDAYTNKTTGEKVVSTEWHNIVVRNKAAEICEKFLSKGDKVYIEGRIKKRQYTTEDGVTHYTTEIIAIDFTFLTTKKNNNPEKANNSVDIEHLYEPIKNDLPENNLPF